MLIALSVCIVDMVLLNLIWIDDFGGNTIAGNPQAENLVFRVIISFHCSLLNLIR